MENIKDFYENAQGIKYYPKLYTESYCFLRAEHYGSVHLKMCAIDQENGEVRFNRTAHGFRPNIDNPNLWMQQNSESMPQQYYREAIRQKVAEANPKLTETAEEKAAIQAENLQRLRESRQRLLDNENSES